MCSWQVYRGITSLSSSKEHTFWMAVRGSFIEYWNLQGRLSEQRQGLILPFDNPGVMCNLDSQLFWPKKKKKKKNSGDFPRERSMLTAQNEKDFRIKMYYFTDTTCLTKQPRLYIGQQCGLWVGKKEPSFCGL